jgi:hypothetical protein
MLSYVTTKGKRFDGTEAYAAPRNTSNIRRFAGGSDIRARECLPPECCAIEPERSNAKQGLTRA